jgi:hypothetical protein
MQTQDFETFFVEGLSGDGVYFPASLEKAAGF